MSEKLVIEKLNKIEAAAISVAAELTRLRDALAVAGQALEICSDWGAPSHLEIEGLPEWLNNVRDPEVDNWVLTTALAEQLQDLSKNNKTVLAA